MKRNLLERHYRDMFFPKEHSIKTKNGTVLFTSSDNPEFLYRDNENFYLAPFTIDSFRNESIYNKGLTISNHQAEKKFKEHVDSLSDTQLFREVSDMTFNRTIKKDYAILSNLFETLQDIDSVSDEWERKSILISEKLRKEKKIKIQGE